MTRVKRRILYAILFTAIAVSMVIIIVYSIRLIRRLDGPWDLHNVVWYSEDPEIEFISKDDDEDPTGYIVVDGERIEVDWYATYTYSYRILRKGTEIISDEDTLIRGALRYETDRVILKIEMDKVYNYKYKEIVLYWRPIESD